ncbi:hypothetical protein [Porphyrobacter sp. YT40]|uniref:hypothetical protein n=1 Tax=Porphyrobacter sp. YT40 TaxID=2547601 RepID=UPI0025743D04|nr:hypothetical protein [Porphyrobacter sp. YT40]
MQHLADRHGEGSSPLAAMAGPQKIPARFLEVILSELTRAGFLNCCAGEAGTYGLHFDQSRTLLAI